MLRARLITNSTWLLMIKMVIYMRKFFGDAFVDFIENIISLGIVIFIIYFCGRLYISNNYSFIVSMKSIFVKDSLYKLNKKPYVIYTERQVYSKISLRVDNKNKEDIKGESVCIIGCISEMDYSNTNITIGAELFDTIKCSLKSEDLVYSFNKNDNVIICGKITDISRKELVLQVDNIIICEENDPYKYDFADGLGELHYYSTWIDKRIGDAIFKFPGWGKYKIKEYDDYIYCEFPDRSYMTIYFWDYDEIKEKSKDYDGNPFEFTKDTLFNLYLLDSINIGDRKYSVPRSETINEIRFTYYRGESPFWGSYRSEHYYTIINNYVIAVSLQYSDDLPDGAYMAAIILGSVKLANDA